MARYGRGKFEAHRKYISYMEAIVKDPAYAGMPNAVGQDGRINWQVSSGKTTSFYKFYKQRFQWWIKKADDIGLPGISNSDDRFSKTARIIHPTKLRPCRLCGKELYVGYAYLNHGLAERWNRLLGSHTFSKGMDVVKASTVLRERLGKDAFVAEMRAIFPERVGFSERNVDDLEAFFVVTGHLRTIWLSPGFMANPPDRLDGFHDYGLCCRKTKDPGRSDENLRTYLHDRRAFQWWTEGDWKTADALYYSAGSGVCDNCLKKVAKISPDHVGPLSCGFKQVPYFVPLCRTCNSSRNRRMTVKDVKRLIDYEKKDGVNVASWQVRAFWDARKRVISCDDDAEKASSIMRSLEDYYLRTLRTFWAAKCVHFVSSFLSPSYAGYEISFGNLDPATLTYSSIKRVPISTRGSRSLGARSVRIAFEELEAYSNKSSEHRKLVDLPLADFRPQLKGIVRLATDVRSSPWSERWFEAVDSAQTRENREKMIAQLLDQSYAETLLPYGDIRAKLEGHFDVVGSACASKVV